MTIIGKFESRKHFRTFMHAKTLQLYLTHDSLFCHFAVLPSSRQMGTQFHSSIRSMKIPEASLVKTMCNPCLDFMLKTYFFLPQVGQLVHTRISYAAFGPVETTTDGQ